MKFKLTRRPVEGTYTRDGITAPVTRVTEARVPILPRDWRALALKTIVLTVLGMTLLSIAWSTWSIGSLLDGGIGFVVAIIFDVAWGVCLGLEYLARYDDKKRELPTNLGWILLIGTMGAIAWHGWEMHSIPMAVVGAAVSLFAKVLWLGVMKHVNAELSDEDKQWIAHQTSAAQAGAAIAEVQRGVAQIEQRTLLVKLAMEAERREVAQAFGLDFESIHTGEPTSVTTVTRLELERPTLADMKVADAVRFVQLKHPELEPTEISELLEENDVTATSSYVAQILRGRGKQETELEPAPLIEDEQDADVIALRK
jgi:hypothetical protein